jgi:hypothetical protein
MRVELTEELLGYRTALADMRVELIEELLG